MSRTICSTTALVTLVAWLPLHAQLLLPPASSPTPAPAPVPQPTTPPANDPNALTWDAESKDYNAKPNETSAAFTFMVTNVSKADVSINSLHTSCGCTVAQLPSQPYTLAPGSNVPINVTVDLHGKMGMISKSVSVDTSAGFKSLQVRVNIPPPTNAAPLVAGADHGANAMGNRAKNIQSALADRQAVFKGECASCHVDKGLGKLAQELYVADCAICHDTPNRAAMVPDLKVPRTERDLAFWQKWIAEGKVGTLMPAFAAAQGGPLTETQVSSLAQFLYETFPKSPPAGPTVKLPSLRVPPPFPQLPVVQKN